MRVFIKTKMKESSDLTLASKHRQATNRSSLINLINLLSNHSLHKKFQIRNNKKGC
jgi:hypothetical protein